MNEVQVNSQGNVQSVDFTSQEPMQPQKSSQTEMMVTRQARSKVVDRVQRNECRLYV